MDSSHIKIREQSVPSLPGPPCIAELTKILEDAINKTSATRNILSVLIVTC